MNRPRIYISGPYTSDPIRGTRAAIFAANDILDHGGLPYVPHMTLVWNLVSPKLHEEWMDYDKAWIPACDLLLRLPGESKGADEEVAEAVSLGIPVVRELSHCLLLLKHGEIATGRDSRERIRKRVIEECCRASCDRCKHHWPVYRCVGDGWFDWQHRDPLNILPDAYCDAGHLRELLKQETRPGDQT